MATPVAPPLDQTKSLTVEGLHTYIAGGYRVHNTSLFVPQSALGTIGQVIEPAIEPLGFDWRIGVGLVTSLAAREVIVGTLGTIYGVETADEESVALQEILRRGDLETIPGALSSRPSIATKLNVSVPTKLFLDW